MRLKLSMLGVALCAAASSFGGVLTNSVGTVGNQAWQGTLGLDFDVAGQNLLVTGLGAFDSGLDGFGANTTIQVGIFNRTTQALVGGTATFSNAAPGTLDGAWRTKALTAPITLLAGGQYSLVAVGFNVTDPNLNTGVGPYSGGFASTNSAPGLLAFVGSSRYDGSTVLAYPTIVDGGPAIRYGAGNMTIQAVPEPASMGALALGALALLRRRVRR